MVFSSRSKPSPYEVRCHRCDVSFPVEQKVCMHCGGPTSRAGTIMYDPSDPYAETDESDYSGGYSGDYTADSAARRAAEHAAQHGEYTTPDIRPGSSGGGPRTSKEESPYSIRDAAGAGARDEDIESDDGAQKGSVLGSLFQSVGGIIWVLLLIGFSLARSCGE